MNYIEQIKEIDFVSWIVILFLILSICIAIYEIICKTFAIFNKPIGVLKQRKEDHELLINTARGLTELQQRHVSDNEECVKHDEEIRADLKKLTNMFIEKQIDDMRYEILDFASSLSSGRKYNKEQFDHILSIDEKYKKILEDNGLENGQVTVSVEYINEVYKEKLRNGF